MDFSDEDDEEEEAPKKKAGVQIADTGGGNEKEKDSGGLARKGTGFVSLGDMNLSDDDDDDEEGGGEKKHVQISADAGSGGKGDKQGGGLARKGTGFVSMGDMDFSDEEDEEEESAPPQPKSKAKTGPKFAVDDDDTPAKKDDGKKHA